MQNLIFLFFLLSTYIISINFLMKCYYNNKIKNFNNFLKFEFILFLIIPIVNILYFFEFFSKYCCENKKNY